MKIKFILISLLAVILSGCVTVSNHAYITERDNSLILEKDFWTEPTCNDYCLKANYASDLLYEKVVRNRPYRAQALAFATTIGENISRAINNPDFNVLAFKQNLLDAARNDAYIKVEISNSVASPTYAQGNILRQAALALTFFENRNLLSIKERSDIILWGNKIARNQIPHARGARSNDSVAMIGVAKMAWGIASKQIKVFERGYSAYTASLPLILGNIGNPRGSRQPQYGDDSPLESINTNLHPLVEGAAILEKIGLKGFSIAYEDHNLRDAVKWFANYMEQNSWRPKEKFRHKKHHGHVWNLGWIPIYAFIFPDAPETKILVNGFMSGYAIKGQPTFDAKNLGGPVDCLWGFNSEWLK